MRFRTTTISRCAGLRKSLGDWSLAPSSSGVAYALPELALGLLILQAIARVLLWFAYHG